MRREAFVGWKKHLAAGGLDFNEVVNFFRQAFSGPQTKREGCAVVRQEEWSMCTYCPIATDDACVIGGAKLEAFEAFLREQEQDDLFPEEVLT